ncbi:uncharacterized protein LOC127442277 isoform X2 [Myxocyprinus asiaticus]|uniref:uncharacterized protein LOC127442277 isoform X2 n=1 Tax=Myxocyprinus asiaticus TaxID=70543 RepID=UPI0022235902|nr:uncharacterized protein LOC127442277 isoform X2 [Myxocyprinus asiaticus]
MKFIYLAAFLCSLVVMGVELAGNDGPEPNCCSTVKDTRILLTNIKRYRIQNTPPCSIRAVVFMTVWSKSICSDPEDSWAKWAMCEVDRRTSNKQPADGCRIISPTSPISTLTPVSTESTQFSVGTTTPGPEKNTSQITYSTYKATNKVTTLAVVTTLSPTYREKEMSKDYKVVTSAEECCLTVTKNNPVFHEIVDYRVQETPLCSFRAIHTMTQSTAGETKWISITAVSPTEKTMTETMFRTPRLDVVTSAKACCLTVTKNKPVFHEIVDYTVQETSLCSIRAVVFITMESKTICSSPKENWVQDYIQNLNRRRKTTETTDNDKEFIITRTKPIEQNPRHSTETTETATAMSLSSMMNDPFHNTNNLFCVKKEPAKYPSSYFCIKQP